MQPGHLLGTIWVCSCQVPEELPAGKAASVLDSFRSLRQLEAHATSTRTQRVAICGYGSTLNHQGAAYFSHGFHLPGFHFGMDATGTSDVGFAQACFQRNAHDSNLQAHIVAIEAKRED